MKNQFIYIVICLVCLGLSACGDDTVECTAATVNGRYEGTLSCMSDGNETSDLYAFDINSNGASQLVIADILGSTTVEWSGCDLMLPEVNVENNFGLVTTTQVTGSFTENMVVFTRTTTTDGRSVVCTFTGTK